MDCLAKSHAHPSSPSPQNSIEASISLSIFQKLPVDVQQNYARVCNSHNAEGGTEWIVAQNSSSRSHLETTEGVVEAQEVPNTHHHETTSPHNETVTTCHAQVNRNDSNKHQVYDRLQLMSEDLQRANFRIKAAIEESRQAARDVCADVFVLRNQLHEESVYQTAVSHDIAKTVGVEAMDVIENQFGVTEDMNQLSEIGKKRRRVKRRKLGESSNQDFVASTTILNYTSSDDENDDTYSDSNGTEADFVDDSYEFYDSRGRPPNKAVRAWNWDRESYDDDDSDVEASQFQISVPWRTLPDFEDDSSDSDYEPPEWYLEDIWELDNPPYLNNAKLHPLQMHNFGDELNDCQGFLSSSGLSSDDTEDGYHDPAIIQRPSQGTFLNKKDDFPPSLGPLLNYVSYEPMFTVYPGVYTPELTDEIRDDNKQYMIQQERYGTWIGVKERLQYDIDFPILDLERRLDVVESGHTQYYFDDVEWTRFEDH